MDSVFNEQILADKLSKINKTQQCIEKLSHWCIFHQSKAEQVVGTWDKQFHTAQMVQKVCLLYLANDILQNSKRKGNEFVNEFWNVLPAALKDVMEKGDDRGKNMVPRLVCIWVERRIFGPRVRILEEMFLGGELLLPPPLESNKKRSRSVRIVKRDSRSIKTKFTVGGTSEKIVSGYHLVLSEHSSENLEMSKCKSVIQNVEEDVDLACRKANRKTLSKYLDEGNSLKQCIEKLKVEEANRITLVSQLREALREEESELDSVRIQLKVAHAQAEKAMKRLDEENFVASLKQSSLTDATLKKGLQVPNKSVSAIAAQVAYKRTASKSFFNTTAQLPANTYQSIVMLHNPSSTSTHPQLQLNQQQQ